MTKFKTLVRKSDEQWAILDPVHHNVYGSLIPVIEENSWDRIKKIHPKIDWSLYELVEVAVIRMDEVPTENDFDVDKIITEKKPKNKVSYVHGFFDGFNEFKERIGS